MSTTETPVARWARLNNYPHGRGHGNRERHARWLREQGLAPEALETEGFPEDPVTLDQWAEFIGENPVTVKSWQRRPDWNVRPRVVGPGWATPRRGKSPNIFSLAELDAYPRPKDRRIDPELFEEGEHLTLHAIAVRAGLDHSETLYQYRGTAEFPPPAENDARTEHEHQAGPHAQALYDARQVAAWYNRRPGRRGKRAKK